jgi:hypothetical protein
MRTVPVPAPHRPPRHHVHDVDRGARGHSCRIISAIAMMMMPAGLGCASIGHGQKEHGPALVLGAMWRAPCRATDQRVIWLRDPETKPAPVDRSD